MRKHAPILVDAMALAAWLLERLEGQQGVLAQRIGQQALELVEALVFGLRDWERARNLDRADERVITLRLHLRLAVEVGLLGEAAMMHALELLDSIGRQLGGWQRSMV